MRDRRRFWVAWLQLASGAVVVFGLAMALLPDLAARGFGALLFADSRRLDTFGADARAYVDLLHAVLGAVLAGWGATLLALARGPIAHGDAGTVRIAALGLATWFVPDTAVSLLTGFWPNAVLNAVFAAALAIPLWALRRPA